MRSGYSGRSSVPRVPGVPQRADLVTNDGVVALEERGERSAVLLGGASKERRSNLGPAGQQPPLATARAR